MHATSALVLVFPGLARLFQRIRAGLSQLLKKLMRRAAGGGATRRGSTAHAAARVNAVAGPGVACGDARTGHQTQKPVALMEVLVRLFSDTGELILDPFAGSGTTGVAALRQGRKFIGWEMNREYVTIARRRIATAREQLEIGF